MLDPNEVALNAKSLSQPHMQFDRSHGAFSYCRRENAGPTAVCLTCRVCLEGSLCCKTPWLGCRLDDDLPTAPKNSISVFTSCSHPAGASGVPESTAQVLVLAQESSFHPLGQHLCGLVVPFSHATWILWLLWGLKFQLHPNKLERL